MPNQIDARMIEGLLGNMSEWRHLPCYQLERRADLFFSLYLVEVLEQAFPECPLNPSVIPEFPIRKGSIPDLGKNSTQENDRSIVNRSFKIDYLVVSKDGERAFLIELKTDMRSTRTDQDDYLKCAREQDFVVLVEGVLELRRASRGDARRKYDSLVGRLAKLGLIEHGETPRVTSKVTKREVVYIQPRFSKDKVPLDNPRWNVQSSERAGDSWIIDFAAVASVVATSKRYPSSAFAKALMEWAKTPAGVIDP